MKLALKNVIKMYFLQAHFAAEAAKYGLAVVFPDTSPRGLNLPGKLDIKSNHFTLSQINNVFLINPSKLIPTNYVIIRIFL